VVGPAFSGNDDPATIGYVKTFVPGWAENMGGKYFLLKEQKDDFFPNTTGEKLNTYTAHQMRDLLYRHKSDKAFAPDSSMVKDGFGLRTTGQTAFEGINEVLGMVNGNDGENSAVTLETTAQNAYGAINELKNSMPAKVSDLTNDSGFLAAPANPQANKVYLYTNSGWSESGVKDTFVAF
jgi:hypothetical protein